MRYTAQFVSCALITLASAAQAQIQMYHDDGTSDEVIGSNGTLSWMNNFSTPVTNNIVQSVEIAWGTATAPGFSGITPGMPFTVHILSDNDSDPSTGTTLLASINANVDATAIDSNLFQSIDVGEILINTTNFWVAAEMTHAQGVRPIAIDRSQASAGRSWIVFGSPESIGSVGMLELDAANSPGVFMLRATVIPNPASATLLGFAGLAAARRRR